MRTGLAMTACVGWVLLMQERPVQAYIDPGSGSMYLQLLLGGVAGVAVAAKLYWQRVVSFVLRRPRQ